MNAVTNHTDFESETALLLTQMLERHPEVQQRDLALSVGMTTKKASAGTIFSNIKSGRAPLPLRHIEAICKALNEEPDLLLKTAIKEYMPEVEPLIRKVYGK